MKIEHSIAFLAGFLLLAASGCRRPATGADQSAELDRSGRGARLFAQHCAVCHGDEGRGDGAAQPYLQPPARDFSFGRFRLASTHDGVPSDADLAATLARGMPGSAMPAWSWMSDKDLTALARHVRELARRGLVERERAAAAQELADFDEAAARARARARTTAGREIALPSAEHYASASAERGAELYQQTCVACHGVDGRGRKPEVTWNEDGSMNWARDFTRGFLKGGATRDDLARRIRVGMPGSTMPASASLSQRDLAALTAHVARMIPPDADRWLVHRRGTIRASRTGSPPPTEPQDERWKSLPETEVVLAPLTWHDDAVFYARIAAVHDGETLCVRVRWTDPTRDDSVLEGVPNCDALALSFSNEATPPLFGMGSHASPVNLWHWRAARFIDMAGILDLLDAKPHLLRDPVFRESRLDVAPLYIPAPSSALSGSTTRELSAEELGRIRELSERNQPVAASARWDEGQWTVVLARSLASREQGEVALAPGARVSLACAVWNGSSGDRGASKSISIWQSVIVE